MAQEVVVNGVAYRYPETGDSKWGDQATKWAVAVSNTTLQKIGGNFPLTNQADFGKVAGIKTNRVSSQSADQLETGFISLGAGETITWSANAVSNSLTVTGNVLTYNGTPILSADGITANLVSFQPYGTVSSTNVQTAIEELATESQTAIEELATEFQTAIEELTTETAKLTLTTGSLITPTGNTAQRDVAPLEGYIRRNSELSQWEGYDGTNWTGIGGASGGGGNPFCYENDVHVTADYTITLGKNAMSAGPITIDDGVTVTIPDVSTWSIV